MAQYQFLNFRFDTHTYHLFCGDKRCDIRPKTALLLAYLITHQGRTLPKKEIFQAVWQSDHVQDHTLFQIISEIRKLASNQELIRTQPNMGYHWVAETVLIQPQTALFKPVAAGLMAFGLLTTSAYFGSEFFAVEQSIEAKAVAAENHLSDKIEPPQNYVLPALTAYSKGVVALENGDHEAAEEWLRFSLSENPDSAETQLLLAESLYLQDNYKDSEHYARLLLEQSTPSTYISSAASDLLSRLYQKQGSLFDALTHAVNGSELLESSQARCTYEILDQRVYALKKLIEQESGEQFSSVPQLAKATPESNLQPGTTNSSVPAAHNSQNASENNSEDLKDCEKIQPAEKEADLSACHSSADFEEWAINHVRFRRFI